jgi:hypothetical protein
MNLDDLIPFVLARCREILGAGGVLLLLVGAERNELYLPYVPESDADALTQPF